jgi:hypothetical protein
MGSQIKFQFHPQAGNHFEPVKIPKKIDTEWENLSGKDIKFFHTKASLSMKTGTYHLPITKGEPLVVKVQSKTLCSVFISTGKIDEGNKMKILLTELDFRFSKPIVLDNVLPVLTSLPQIFDDKNIQYLKSFLNLFGGNDVVKKFNHLGIDITKKIEKSFEILSNLNQNFLENLKEWNLEPEDNYEANEKPNHPPDSKTTTMPEIHLNKIKGKPKKINNLWVLELSFSGEIRYSNTSIYKFIDTKLPTEIIPALHAELEQLLSSMPLSSAKLKLDKVDTHGLSREFFRLIHSYHGNFQIETSIPKAIIEVMLPNHSLFTIELLNKESYLVSGKFSGKNNADGMRIWSKNINIKSEFTNINCSMDISIDNKRLKERFPGDIILDLLKGKTWDDVSSCSSISINIIKNSFIKKLNLLLSSNHTSLIGESNLKVCLTDIHVYGKMELKSNANTNSFIFDHIDIKYSGDFFSKEGVFDDGRFLLYPKLTNGEVQGKLLYTEQKLLELTLDGSNDVLSMVKLEHEEIPELEIEKGYIEAKISGKLQYHIQIQFHFISNNYFHASIKNTSVTLEATSVLARLDKYHIIIPKPCVIAVKVKKGNLDATGLGNLDMWMYLDMKGQIPRLQDMEKAIDLLYASPKPEKMRIIIETGGKVNVKGSNSGLFDSQFFQAILYPEQQLEKWNQIFESPSILKHIQKLSNFFSTDTGSLVYQIRKLSVLIRKAIKKENIKTIGDILPVSNFVNLLVQVSHRPDLEKTFYHLTRDIVDGKGLDQNSLETIIQELYSNYHRDKHKIKKLISIASILLDPLTYPKVSKELTPSEPDSYTWASYISADNIYQTISNGHLLTIEFISEIEKISHYLRIAQLEWILRYCDFQKFQSSQQHIKHVLELKKRIHLAREEFGGLSHFPQTLYINFFLSDLSEIVFFGETQQRLQEENRIQKGYIGPSEAAILLLAILSSPTEGKTAQLNLKLLFDVVAKKPENFLFYMLIEVSDDTPRVLTQVLYRLFTFKQNLLKEPIPLYELFYNQLQIKVPSFEKSIQTSKSYYAILSKITEKITLRRAEYDSLKKHLQVHTVPKIKKSVPSNSLTLRAQAQELILYADTTAGKIDFHKPNAKTQAAISAYRDAFDVCAGILKIDPAVFQETWFKNFWHRNYEALMVLSVLKNYEENIDTVRNWLHVQSSQKTFVSRQDLLDAIIEVLYKKTKDKNQLKKDPLVRLLIEQPNGKYNFSIVSCMGIITQGETGKELDASFQRVKEKRGVETYRTDTKILRSLRSNSRIIEKTIQTINTPFGILGYSQGCANALATESSLLSGTPEQRNQIQQLKTRNLIYGAANGSIHGDTGDIKFYEVMQEVELYIHKYFQKSSMPIQDSIYDILSAMMSSRRFVHITGGMNSISSKGSYNMAWYGQFLEHVPTFTIRGEVDHSTLPEANEMLSNLLSIQSGSKEHDTQVSSKDAVGYFTKFSTEASEILKKNDIGSFVQKTHHWAPLFEEVQPLKTKRDEELAIYETPKDRHVFPWIEVNARFGVIE